MSDNTQVHNVVYLTQAVQAYNYMSKLYLTTVVELLYY